MSYDVAVGLIKANYDVATAQADDRHVWYAICEGRTCGDVTSFPTVHLRIVATP
jgi:hypothetical protein